MCSNGKCLHCIPIEHGSLAFAILSMIGTASALLWSIVQGIIIAVDSSHPHTTNVEGDHEGVITIFKGIMDGLAILAMQIFVTIVAVVSIIAFFFSALLFVGIRTRRPAKVLAYFIYGCVTVVLSAACSVCYLSEIDDNDEYYSKISLPGVIGLALCALYLPCLVMVYKTYTKLQQAAMFENHIPLVENKNDKLDP